MLMGLAQTVEPHQAVMEMTETNETEVSRRAIPESTQLDEQDEVHYQWPKSNEAWLRVKPARTEVSLLDER